MNSISACLIVKNEEESLKDCLHSLTDIVDEIIIVDTGSTDRTKAIANEYGAIIIDAPWEYDFSKARNIALQNASCEWILSIDADEQLMNPDQVLRTLNNVQTSTGGFLISVQSFFERADGGKDVFTTNLLRLFRNRENIQFEGIIHEQVLESIFRSGYEVAYTTIHFLHTGYNLSPTSMVSKQERNLQLLSKALERKPNDAYNLMQRGKTYMALGKNDEAEKDLTLSLKYVKNDSIVTPQSLNYLGIVQFQRKAYIEAIENAEKSLSILPKQGFAQFILGECYTELQNYQKALQAYLEFEKCSNNPDPLASVAGEYTIPKEQIYFRIGRTCTMLRDYKKAEEIFKLGLTFNKKEAGCLVGLADIALKLGKEQLAIQFLEYALKLYPLREDIQVFLQTAKSYTML